ARVRGVAARRRATLRALTPRGRDGGPARARAARGLRTTRAGWSTDHPALVPLRGRAGSQAAQDRDDAPEHLGVVARDRVVRGVVRHEPDVAVGAAQALDRGLAVDHRRDDLAVLGD